MIDNRYAITTQKALCKVLGQNVKRWREERGWSQQKLADYIGSQQYIISHIETKPSFAPSIFILIKLAAAFEKNFDELMT